MAPTTHAQQPAARRATLLFCLLADELDNAPTSSTGQKIGTSATVEILNAAYKNADQLQAEPPVYPNQPPTEPTPSTGTAQIVERNIRALLEREQQRDRQKSWQNRVADVVTGFTGSMTFVFIHLALFGGWIMWNLGWLGLKPFDPSFVVLAMFASVEAIFLSTFVLISQNRMAELADRRANLDLQVSLLSEHEITRLIILVTEMAKKMDIKEAHDPEIPELAQDIRPEKVLNTIEQHEARFADQQTNSAASSAPTT
ncbi:DUF1003 domain-containing protein [Hymenobacter sp. YC55]|uniref:DUF1003 domain-containing protein n=1 Tax=Hymenobacter sp. YC55 TaxID=3034019 RepID=UPI0023F8D1C3|nr:DUF1003 domain-containing protein [Hymenobacter sp. YC55]MDF7810841.1 DUF1003 domain-containing protein [Hymenobacter sp. YC55]